MASPLPTDSKPDTLPEGDLAEPRGEPLPAAGEVLEMVLVDEDEPPSAGGGKALLTPAERRVREAAVPGSAAHGVEESPRGSLALPPDCLARGHRASRDFSSGRDPSEVGEEILRELVAGEFSIALALQDVEAAAVSLLARTVTDPKLSLAVARSLAEAVALSGAVRRRLEGSLGAAASLRAQRLLLAGQRGQSHE